MAKKIILAFFVLIIADMVTANLKKVTSSGAPAGSTGGPDEIHCSNAGCHDDKSINSGKATSLLEIDGLEEGKYIPGKTYKIKVNISEPQIMRFGFQVVILDSEGNNAGKLEITDATRTQIIQNYVKSKDREYVTYTYNGTSAKEIGKTDWEFNWTAPASFPGKVTVYMATVSANSDNTDKGDYSYKSSFDLLPAAVNIKFKKATKLSVIQKGRELNISDFLTEQGKSEIRIYDLKGKLIFSEQSQTTQNGYQSFNITIPAAIPSAIYVLTLLNNGKVVSTSKMILTF